MSNPWPDEPFTTQMAHQLGFGRNQLSRAVQAAELRRVVRGVYQTTELPDTLMNRCRALELVMRPFDVITDRTAAWLHGIDTFDPIELDVLPLIDRRALRGNARARCVGTIQGVRDLAPHDVMRIGALQVTTPLRTALDLGCMLRPWAAVAAMDAFMRTFGITKADLRFEIVRFRRRRGVVTCRWVVHVADPRSESGGESFCRCAIIECGLPWPTPQLWVYEGDEPRYRLDLAYRWAKVAIEYDGRGYHDSPAQRAADIERREWLREHGWIVIVVRAEDLTADRVAQWTGDVANALRSRSRI